MKVTDEKSSNQPFPWLLKKADLPDDYEFLLYRIGDPSRVEIEY
jgi:hypothetical protein